MDNIKVFKLISGEEIIAEIFNHFDRHIELKKPASIVMQRTEQGVGVGLAPYMPYSTGNIDLHRTAIASSAEPDTQMVNEYNRIFGSGIEVVPASALAGIK
jgi:hypothetical protein